MDTKFWGPPMWVSLHSIAHGYPKEPTEEQQQDYKTFMMSVGKVLPCRFCRESFIKFSEEMPIDNYLSSKKELQRWMYLMHNKVNEKLLSQGENLKSNPSLHDKIEFGIIFTCFTLSTDNRLKELKKNNFSRSEILSIKKSLIEITNNSFKKYNDNIKSLEVLDKKFHQVSNSSMYYIDKIYWLVEDCKNYGTIAFAGLARCAFVAIDLLNSMVDKKIISENEKYEFLKSINTITSKISTDATNLKKSDFIEKYGHLRPNTYDICSVNYQEGYSLYFKKKTIRNRSVRSKNKFRFKNSQLSKINIILKKSKINLSAHELVKFIKESIESREYAKYKFTKNIDQILNLIKDLAKRNKISTEEISFIEIQSLLDLYYNLTNENVRNKLLDEIKKNRRIYEFNENIKLPHNILNSNDIFYYISNNTVGNFIGNNDIESDLINLEKFENQNLEEKIVFIESADPGYDFIFTKNIGGLITKFGGANSHMAIRCAELGIPAAIGIGEKLFENLKTKKRIKLNCKNSKIDIIV